MSVRSRAPWYFYGSTLSRVGDEMAVPALLLFALAVSGSARAAASAYAALTLAGALGGPLLGLVLDRSRRPGAVLTSCLVLYGTGLGVLTLAGRALPLAAWLVVAAATGIFGPAVAGGWSSQLPRAVPGRPRAYSLDVATYNLAGILGPAATALLATASDPGVAMLGAVVLVLAAVPAAWTLPAGDGTGSPLAPGVPRALLRELGLGFRPLLRVPPLRGVTVGSSLSFVGIGMLVVACPLVGAERFGDPARGALLITALATASLVATVVTARWPLPLSPDQVVLLATLVQGLGLVCLAVSSAVPVTVLAVVLVGLADGPQLAAVFAIRHRDSPRGNRAQVFTTAVSLKVGSAAAGGALAGLLADSLTVVVLVAAISQAAAIVAALLCGTPVRPTATAGPPPPHA